MNLIDIEQEDTILSPNEVFTVSTVGAIPHGFDGRPIMEWIDDVPSRGTIGDAAACNDIQNQINNQQASRNQLNQTKIELQQAALEAAQAGDQATAAQLTAQANSMGAQIVAVDSSIAQLKKLKETCMGLAPGCDPQTPCPAGLICVDGKCVQPGTPPPPKCSTTNPCPAGQKCVDGNCVTVPTTASKPASRSWLLLAGSALVAGFFALKGA